MVQWEYQMSLIAWLIFINYRLLCYTLIAMLRFPYCSIGQWSRCSWSHFESRPLCSALHCSRQPIQCWSLSSELLSSGLVVQVQVWIILFVFCCPCLVLWVHTNHVLLIRPQQERKMFTWLLSLTNDPVTQFPQRPRRNRLHSVPVCSRS